MSDKPLRVDANTFQVQLDTLASTMIERIKDEWPAVLGDPGFAQGFFLMNMRYARDTFRAVRSICSDERQEDHRWHWNEILLLPPTNRTLLDVLFNQIFLSEDILKQSNWYHQSGWREQKLEFDRLKGEYGNFPEWKQNLADYQALVDKGVDLFGISAEQIAHPKLIQSWPTPGQMPDYGINPLNRNDDRQFLHYLTDWFYREHSAQSHMSFLGQMKLSPLLFSRRSWQGRKRRNRAAKASAHLRPARFQDSFPSPQHHF